MDFKDQNDGFKEADLEELEKKTSKEKFNFEQFANKNKFSLLVLLLGLILAGLGVILVKNDIFKGSSKVEVLDNATQPQASNSGVVVEIAGAVEKPGVYKMKSDARIEDLLIASGGISPDADRDWLDKTLNRASKLTDGQKIFIPKVSEQSVVLSANNSGGNQTASLSQGSGTFDLVNINTATLKELDTLQGIGPVHGQNIIDHRPYSNTEELVSKKVLTKSVYDKIKEKITTY